MCGMLIAADDDTICFAMTGIQECVDMGRAYTTGLVKKAAQCMACSAELLVIGGAAN